jgi:hypothetical protein
MMNEQIDELPENFTKPSVKIRTNMTLEQALRWLVEEQGCKEIVAGSPQKTVTVTVKDGR